MPSREDILDLGQVEGALRNVYISPSTIDDLGELLIALARKPTIHSMACRPNFVPREIFANREGNHLLVFDVAELELSF